MTRLPKEYYEYMTKMGAVSDGITDDTAAIQATIHAQNTDVGKMSADHVSQVREEMAHLNKAIEEHGQKLDVLMGRLQPVFRIEEATPTSSAPEVQLVELANAIRELRHRIEDQTRTLMDALTLIEL